MSNSNRHPTENLYKAHLVDNLETLLIGGLTNSIWPEQLKELIADTILCGRFKYHDAHSRTYRVEHLSTLTIGTPSHSPPTKRDTFQEKRVYTLYHSVCTALDILHKHRVFTADIPACLALRESLFDHSTFQFNPDEPTCLGSVSDLVYDVATQSSRPPLQIIDIILTTITGVPCICPEVLHADMGVTVHDVNLVFQGILLVVTDQVLLASNVKNAEPGDGWRLTHYARLQYLEKLQITARGHCDFTLLNLYTLSKLDMCHVVLETGVALKRTRSKICYVAPVSLTFFITSAVADLPMSEDEIRSYDFKQQEDYTRPLKHHLLRNVLTRNAWRNALQLTSSANGCRFSLRYSLERLLLILYPEIHMRRVATNKHGDALFFVDIKGPWLRPVALTLRDDSLLELMKGTVQGYIVKNVARPIFWRVKGPVQPAESGSPEPDIPHGDSGDVIKACKPMAYKPKTLNSVINKPGRVLVKRKGIRGAGGRFIVAGIITLGLICVVLNFAGRDNWLERAFDGAQVMSLVAGLVVGAVYVINGTLTSTLDWLSGQTEVSDEVQQCRVLSASLEEVKLACTYEKEFLFWLSDVNSCFCPAGKYGSIMFSEPLDMNKAASYVEHCSVIDREDGLWLLQGWPFKIEQQGDIGHMVKVPYEDKVYVDRVSADERKITRFGSRQLD
ncbi:hypothetical protein FGB62_112g28 [Gracilaria domingensis]|nr:hypothetical protein FGB62_112g28 [Gracilaria domingensis]